MRQMHDYKGWRFGLTALEQAGRWSARIEVYEPGRPSREQSPMPLPSPHGLQARKGFWSAPGSTRRLGSTNSLQRINKEAFDGLVIAAHHRAPEGAAARWTLEPNIIRRR